MANKFLLLPLVFCLSCVSSTVSKKNELKFSELEQLVPGVTTKAEIFKKFGAPNSFNQDYKNLDRESVAYNSVEGFQRLTLYFIRSSGQLESILWLPRENESESTIDGIFKKYGKNNFKKEQLPQLHPHMVTPRYSYISEDLGIIVLNERRDEVEAIAFSSPIQRKPADYSKKNDSSYRQ